MKCLGMLFNKYNHNWEGDYETDGDVTLNNETFPIRDHREDIPEIRKVSELLSLIEM